VSRISASIQKLRNEQPNKPVIKKLPSKTGPNAPRKGLRILPPEREKIVQMRIPGKTEREVQRETGRSRESIRKILAEADIPEYVEELRGHFQALGEIALKSIEVRMRKDPDFAYRFLLDIGVIPRGDTIPIMPPAGAEKPLSATVRDQLLAALTQRDKIKFGFLQMGKARDDAYGYPPMDLLTPEGNSAPDEIEEEDPVLAMERRKAL
jgi:hypothetical protein